MITSAICVIKSLMRTCRIYLGHVLELVFALITAFLFKMSTRARLSALARSEAAQKTLSQLKKRYLKKIRVHNHSPALPRDHAKID